MKALMIIAVLMSTPEGMLPGAIAITVPDITVCKEQIADRNSMLAWLNSFIKKKPTRAGIQVIAKAVEYDAICVPR